MPWCVEWIQILTARNNSFKWLTQRAQDVGLEAMSYDLAPKPCILRPELAYSGWDHREGYDPSLPERERERVLSHSHRVACKQTQLSSQWARDHHHIYLALGEVCQIHSQWMTRHNHLYCPHKIGKYFTKTLPSLLNILLHSLLFQVLPAPLFDTSLHTIN